MRILPLLAPAAALALAGCVTAERPSFTSKQEEACYDRVAATLAPNERLRRDRNGVFVKVTTTEGFVDDIDRSPEFDACMAENRIAGSAGDIGTITFTPEEQVIWDSLTDAARKEALEFIRNGGTLKEFVAR